MRSSAIVDRVAALLERSAPFDRLRDEDRRRLLGEVLVEYFEAGEVVLEQGRTTHEHVYLVESGFVRLVDAATGRLAAEYGEGGVFGSHGPVRGGPLPYEARAAEPTVCVLVRVGRFRELYEANRDFASFFESDLVRYTRASELPLGASSARLLFGTRIGDIVGREPVTCDPDVPVGEAAREMRREGVDSTVVVRGGRVVGILSDIDLRNNLVAEAAPYGTPVGRVMSPDPVMLRGGAPVFEALMAMMRERAFHVVVTDGVGPEAPLLGVVSDVDISRSQGYSPAYALERAEEAGSAAELSRVRDEVNGLLIQLHRRGVRPGDLITINTEINDRLMARAVRLAEMDLVESSPNLRVDLPWAWLSLGSEGRGEMGLKTDQDNALVYADPAPGDEERAQAWFGALAGRANGLLAEAGFAPCKGGVMARNPKWRRSLSGWKETFRRWVGGTDANDLLDAGIFFDLRPLCGEASLGAGIQASVKEALRANPRFLHFVARNALAEGPARTIFRRFAIERSGQHRGTVDLKRRGTRPLVDLARLLAMQLAYLDSPNTNDRFQHAARAMPDARRSIRDADEAHSSLAELRFVHQLRRVEAGQPPDNHVDPYALGRTQQSVLETALSTIKEVQDVVARRHGIS